MKYAKSASKKRTTKKRTIKKKLSVPTAIKSYVRSAIHRTAETKIASTQTVFTGLNSAIGLTDFFKLMPIMTQGTAQNNRIGSEVKPIKLVVRGYLVYNSYDNSNATMIGPRLFAFQQKQIRSYSTTPNDINMLDNGGDGSPFNGNAIDYCQPHNKDAFFFYADKKTRMMKPYGYTNNITATQSMTDVPSNLFFPFVITMKPGTNGFPSILKYDNGGGTNQYPMNFAPYLAAGYSYLLNFTPDSVTTQIGIEFVSTLYYEDA